MEQPEFNATQAINETCYDLAKHGCSLRDIYNGLSNVMDGAKPNHVTKGPIVSLHWEKAARRALDN